VAWASVDAAATRAQLQADYAGVQYYSHNDGRLATVYNVPFSFGESPEESAARFVQDYSGVFGVPADDLVPGLAHRDMYTLPMMYDPDTDSYKFTLVYYSQYRDGIPVFRGELRLLVRNEDGYPLVLAQSDIRELGAFSVPAGFDGYAAEGAAHAAAIAAVPSLINFSPAELVIWAGVDDMAAAPKVAITFTADSGEGSFPYENWLFVADAASGEILYQENQVYHVDIVGNVSGWATIDYRADACASELTMPLPYLKVTRSGGEAYTDINGNFVLANPGSTPVDVTSTLTGRWFYVVNNGTGGNASITLNVTPPGPANFVHNQSGAEHQTAEVNGYLQANIVRDMVLGAKPNYPNIYNQSSPMKVTVNINSTCNAYYSASTINFYRSGGGCNNTAFGDVIHHEYGHHVVAMGGSGQGEYGEGMSDSIALLITGRSELAIGFQSCTAGIRNANNNCKYVTSGCSTCGSAIHTCGQLLSGCVWDTWQELKITEPVNHLAIIRRLTVESVLLHGSGTSITPQITIHFLTLDDNDGNINNGTPHYYEIATGFGKHDMPAPPLSLLGFTYPNGRPDFISPAGGTTVRVNVGAIAGQPKPASGKFYYDAGSGWVTVPMTEIAPNQYEATFPAVPCGRGVKYYFSAETTNNMTVKDPADAPAVTYATLSGYGLNVYFTDDFETNQGWTVNAGATLGNWERAVPQQTTSGGVIFQPGEDHSPNGTMCWVTGPLAGSSVGAYDVDGGPTLLISPTFDLSDSDAVVSYWRWYHISTTIDDEFLVQISNNNGSTWTTVERLTDRTAPWQYAEWVVGNYITPTAQMRIRFYAIDNPNNSIVEALVDDFEIRKIDCNPPFAKGDLNCDGQVNFGDINPFVLALTNPAGYAAQFPNCDIMLGDINGDGLVNFGDINPFVRLLTNP